MSPKDHQNVFTDNGVPASGLIVTDDHGYPDPDLTNALETMESSRRFGNDKRKSQQVSGKVRRGFVITTKTDPEARTRETVVTRPLPFGFARRTTWKAEVNPTGEPYAFARVVKTRQIVRR